VKCSSPNTERKRVDVYPDPQASLYDRCFTDMDLNPQTKVTTNFQVLKISTVHPRAEATLKNLQMNLGTYYNKVITDPTKKEHYY
jgi:hypothetical protein